MVARPFALARQVATSGESMGLAEYPGWPAQTDYRVVSDDEMGAALKQRDRAGTLERNTCASDVGEALLSRLEAHGHEIVYQSAPGAEPLPFGTGSRLLQRAVEQLPGSSPGHAPADRYGSVKR